MSGSISVGVTAGTLCEIYLRHIRRALVPSRYKEEKPSYVRRLFNALTAADYSSGSYITNSDIDKKLDRNEEQELSFNYMVNYKLDSIFSSLSDPTRRDILQRLLH